MKKHRKTDAESRDTEEQRKFTMKGNDPMLSKPSDDQPRPDDGPRSGLLLGNAAYLLCEGVINFDMARADSVFLEALKAADVIVGEDINGHGSSIFYGRELVERSERGERMNVAGVQIDSATDDCEKLSEIVRVVKGSCDYGRVA
jgi:hypothetical protein